MELPIKALYSAFVNNPYMHMSAIIRLRGANKDTNNTFGNAETKYVNKMLDDIDKVENTKVANLTFTNSRYIMYRGIRLDTDLRTAHNETVTIFIYTPEAAFQPQVLVGYGDHRDHAFDKYVKIKSGEIEAIIGSTSIDDIIFACAVYNRVLSILAIAKEMHFESSNFTEEIRSIYFDPTEFSRGQERTKVVAKIDKDFIIRHIPIISKALEKAKAEAEAGGGRGSDYVTYNARRYKIRKEGRKKYILVKNEHVYLGSIRGKYKPC